MATIVMTTTAAIAIRRGSEIVQALALGADAVLLGRAMLYGLAAGGEPGVARAIEIIATEISRTLALLGLHSVGELTPHSTFAEYGLLTPDEMASLERAGAVGDVLCIIESMKMMNQIEAERGGRIVEVIARDGTPVETGAPLFRIE